MKNLFFAVLVAVAAVGSAYAQDYSTGAYGSGIKFSCTTSISPTCENILGISPIVYIYNTSRQVALWFPELDLQYYQF